MNDHSVQGGRAALEPAAGRSNASWLQDLKAQGKQQAEALDSLRAVLLRAVRAAFGNSPLTEADLEDLVQDALLRIIDRLDSYRGEARFTTWATKVAVNIVYSELRRLRWRDISLEAERGDELPGLIATLRASVPDPEQRAIRNDLYRVLSAALQKLSPRQRHALLAVHWKGMPVAEVATRMKTNRNALYKLIHDARVKLRDALSATGVPAEEILNAFE